MRKWEKKGLLTSPVDFKKEDKYMNVETDVLNFCFSDAVHLALRTIAEK